MDEIVKDFYGLAEDVEDSAVWDAWKKGYLSIKPFSMQVRECKGNGNLVLEACCHCGKYLLLCKKYGGQCISNKCRDERVTLAKDFLEALNAVEPIL